MQSPLVQFASWIFAAVMLGAMAIIGLVCAFNVYLELQAPIGNYLATTATVTSSEVLRNTHSNVGKNSSWQSYDVVVAYVYEVGGITHASIPQYVDSFASNWDETQAEAIAEEYAIGSHMTVYYDPANPATSRLTANREWTRVIVWGIATLLFLGYPLYLIIDTLRRKMGTS